MGGLAVFSLIGLYIFAGYKFVKLIRPGYRKWLAIAALALIPTADAVVGRVYLQHLCATEGGLKVYRVAQGVEGYMGLWHDSLQAVEEYNFKFSEGTPRNGLVIRYSKENGKVVKEINVIPKSKFRIRLQSTVDTEKKVIYPRTTKTVETFPGGEVLSKDVQIGFNGGWAERLLGGFSDAGAGPVAHCEGKDALVRTKELILSTLKH